MEERVKYLKAVLNMAKYERMVRAGAMGGNTVYRSDGPKPGVVCISPTALPSDYYNDPNGKRYVHIPEPEVADEFLD